MIRARLMTTANPSASRLHSDDRGAIMLVALAFAVFGVAMLYYAIGIGQTVLLREHMQDGADGAALTAAVVHARSMNFIVLLNIIMAALIAVLVALKLVEGLALVGIIIAAALAFFTGGSSLSAIPPLKAVAAEMSDLYDTLKDPIFNALEILHSTADAVALATPAAARQVAKDDLTAHSSSLVDGGELVAMRTTQLPVEDDTFDKLCHEGGSVAGTLALEPFAPIIPGGIRDELSSALGDLTGAMSAWFCGESDGPPPSPPPMRKDKPYPRTEGMDHCQYDKLSALERERAKQDPANFQTEACTESRKDAEAAAPDEITGECQRGRDCSESGPYEVRAQLARSQCSPTSSPPPHQYSYQTRAGKVTYRYTKAGWVRGTPEYAPPTFVKDQARPPCGPESVSPSVAVGYEAHVRATPGGDVQPLCSNEVAPTLPPLSPDDPPEQVVEFTEVRHMLSCVKSVLEPIKVSDAQGVDDSDDSGDTKDTSGSKDAEDTKSTGDSSGSDDDKKYPKRVRDGLQLGSEIFQVRAVIRTKQVAAKAERAVKLSLWGADAPSAEPPTGHELAPFAFAQAEYFYDGTEGADAWMWNMNWRARLRVFRLPTETDDKSIFLRKVALAFGLESGAKFAVNLLMVEKQIAH